jgi:MFS family permease
LNTRALPVRVAPRVSGPFIAVYALAYAALWLALLTPAIISLALRVRQLAPDDSARAISSVLVTGAIVALVSNPLFGALSDRARSSFGRRRPFLIAGVVGGCAALAVIGLAPNVTVVLVGWCLAQLAYNAALAAIVAIVPDQIPAAQRGTVVGILGICMPIGQISGTYLVRELSFNTVLMLVVPGLLGAAAVLLLAYVLPDAPAVTGDPVQSDASTGRFAREQTAERVASVESTELSPTGLVRNRRNLAWAWLSRVLFTAGSCFLQAYQPFLLLDKLHFAAREVPGLIFRSTLVSAAMVVAWSLIAGRLSDRAGTRKPFVMIGALVQAAGLWNIAMADSYTMLLVGVAITGIGHGIYEGVDLALVTEVLPDRDHHAAQDLGILNIANTLPQVIAPLAAPAILSVSQGDYSLLFCIAAALSVFGSLVLVPLKGRREL